MRKQTVLQPTYMNVFQCIGPQCEDSCCSGWKVTIDHETYRKYSKSRDPELAPLFDKKVTRNRSNPTNESYAKIKMDIGGHCPFLNEEKLCRIQKNLGEAYLSNTCAVYPRSINELDGVLEKSAALSCPEIARLALLNSEGISFDEIEVESDERSIVHNRKNTKAPTKANKVDRYFWEVRIFTIEILQDRSYKVGDRLILMGLFYQKLQTLIEEERVAEVPQLIATYTTLLRDGSLRTELAQIPANLSIQMQLSKEMMDQRLTGGFNNRYMQCLIQYLNGLRYTKESSVEEVTERYKTAYDNYYAPFMDEHEYIFENYLVNYVFKKMFPLSSEKTVFDAYVMMVVQYAMLKLHLIGMSAYNKKLDEDMIVLLFQSFTRMVEHNNAYVQKMNRILIENGYTTMPYMAILIKN